VTKVLAIEQDYDTLTTLAQAFRKATVYSHPSLAGSSPEHELKLCANGDAVPAVICPIAAEADVRFITGTGHGRYGKFTGQGGVVIWDSASVPADQAKGKIIHLLSCQTGGILGRAFVQKGAVAFWGYSTDFTVWFGANGALGKIEDIFFQFDAMIDLGILDKLTAGEIYTAVANYFWKMYSVLLMAEPVAADTLLDDFAHLVSPVSWGDAEATLT
jgi:hypothetical protein